jgi:uncharacterized protein (DUF305 family)
MPGGFARRVIVGLVALALIAIPAYVSAARLPMRQDNGTPAPGPCAPVPSSATPAASPVVAGNASDYPFDLVFIDAMLFNLEATVAMAEIARQTSERQQVLDIVDGIISTQVGDITQLRAWRTAWYPDADPVPANVVTGLGDEGLMTSGALSGSGETSLADDTATAVQRLCAPDGPFDLAFLAEMIPLQQRAVGMARLALDRAEHAELKALAEEIVMVQDADVSQMIAWLAEWYPPDSLNPGGGTPTA